MEIKITRDARLDQIGFVGEVQKLYADGLKDDVKTSMIEKGIEQAEGDFFEAKLVAGTVRTLDPDKLTRLYDRKVITRAQFVSALKINRDAALEFLSREDAADISTESPMALSLRVSRKKKVEISLVYAITSLAKKLMKS